MIAFVGGALSTVPMTVLFASHPNKDSVSSFHFGIGGAQVLLGKLAWNLSISVERIIVGSLGGLLPLLVLWGFKHIRDHCSPEGQRSRSQDCPPSTEK